MRPQFMQGLFITPLLLLCLFFDKALGMIVIPLHEERQEQSSEQGFVHKQCQLKQIHRVD